MSQRIILTQLIFVHIVLNIAFAVGAVNSATIQAPSTTEIIAHSTAADWRVLDPENTVYLQLTSGRVVMELAPAFAPLHTANIKALVREQYFDGLALLRSQDNYVVQWGDPEAGNPGKAKPIKSAQSKLTPEFSIGYDSQFPFTRLPDKDGYAPQVGFSDGFAAGRNPRDKKIWLTHCYGAVGVGRDVAADSGNGTELYVVIGNAPRHLDRNITLVGRVIHGMELLSVLPRGIGALGFYQEARQRLPIISMKVAADVPLREQTQLEIMRTDTQTWNTLVESRRNRHEEWFKVPAGHVDLCNVPVPVRIRSVAP